MRTHKSSFKSGGTVPSFITVRKWAIIDRRWLGRSATVRNMLGMLPRSCRYVSKIGRTSAGAASGASGLMRGSAMRSLPRALPYAPRVSRRHAVGASALPPPDLEQLDGRPVAELPHQHAHAERGEEQRAVEPPPQQHPYLGGPEIAGEPLHERNLEPPTPRRQRDDERGMDQRQRAEEHLAERRPARHPPGERGQDEGAGAPAPDGEQRPGAEHPAWGALDVRQRHAPLPSHAMPDHPRPDQALQQVYPQQHHQGDDLDRDELTCAVTA